MREDFDPGLEHAYALDMFEQMIYAQSRIDPDPWRYAGKRPPFFHYDSLDDSVDNFFDRITAALKDFVTIGDHLMMGSTSTIVDCLKGFRQVGNELWLFGNRDGDQEADGYMVRPRSMTLAYGHDPGYSVIVVDNIPRPANLLQRRREILVFAMDNEQSYDLVDLQVGHHPLLIFPHGSAYLLDELRNAILDAYRVRDLRQSRPVSKKRKP